MDNATTVGSGIMYSEAQAIVRGLLRQRKDGRARLWVTDAKRPERTGWRLFTGPDAVEHLMQGSAAVDAPAGAQERDVDAPAPPRSGAEGRQAPGQRVSPIGEHSVNNVPPPAVQTTGEGLTADELAAMAWGELKRLAGEAGVTVGGRTRDAIEQDLVGYEVPPAASAGGE